MSMWFFAHEYAQIPQIAQYKLNSIKWISKPLGNTAVRNMTSN